MNKIFKLVWSKVKNCYVVVSELAKNRTKAPDGKAVSHTVVVGILTCVLSCGTVMSWMIKPAMASTVIIESDGSDTMTHNFSHRAVIYSLPRGGQHSYSIDTTDGYYIAVDTVTGEAALFQHTIFGASDANTGVKVYRYTDAEAQNILGVSINQAIANVTSSDTYIAGSGITISSDNKVYV